MRLIVLVLACAVISPHAVNGALVASSSLEQCFDDGVSSLSCANKMVVSLTIASGQRGTEEIRTVLGCNEGEVQTANPTSSTCELESPIRLTLSKTEVVVRYPVTYLQSFNAAPREVVTHHGLGGCDDGNLAPSPSCGWVLASDGSRIRDSQGFCCSCGFDQIFGTSSTSTRSTALHCDLFGNAQSAHCLRMDQLWYAAYTLGPPQLHFTITVEATQANGTMTEYTLEMGPHAPGAASPDGRVTARLLGDLAAYTGDMPPLGQTKYLMVPSQPTTHARVTAGVDSWLLVDRQAVTLDGFTCNKIGTSYAAFRHQANVCTNQAGSCLRNQLEDLQQVDDQRVQRGEPPLYRASALGAFAPYADGAGAQYVAYTTTTARNSLITLTLNADSIRFVIAESVGHIDTITAEDFEAQSARGRLVCAVTNTGAKTADYSLRISCTDGIMGGTPARTLSLTPMEQRHVSFPLYAEHSNASQHMCIGELYGSRQTLLSAANVSFFTTERIEDRGAQAGEVAAAPGRVEVEPLTLSIEPCELLCQSFFDFPCFLAFGCSSKLSRLAIVLFCMLLVLTCLCCCLCACCNSSRFRSCVCRILCCGLLGRPDHPRRRHDNGASSHYTYDDYHQRQPRPREYDGWRSRRARPLNRPVSHAPETDVDVRKPDAGLSRRLSMRLPMSTRRKDPEATSRIAYLNMSGSQAAAAANAEAYSWLKSPGDQYSLRGVVVEYAMGGVRTAPLEDDFFHLGCDGLQYWRWSESELDYVHQSRPSRLSRAFFRMPFNSSKGSNLESLKVVSAFPVFHCINMQQESFDALNKVKMSKSAGATGLRGGDREGGGKEGAGRRRRLAHDEKSDARIPPGGSVGKGGIILDEDGEPVLGADRKPMYVGAGVGGGVLQDDGLDARHDQSDHCKPQDKMRVSSSSMSA